MPATIRLISWSAIASNNAAYNNFPTPRPVASGRQPTLASTVAQTCGPQGVQGSPNVIKNNILAFSRESIKQQGCTPSGPSNKLFDMTSNLVIFDMGNIQGGCYSCLGGNCASVLPATVL